MSVLASPGLSVFIPPSLSPDKVTGLGKWTTKQIVTGITAGPIRGGRILAPIMPQRDFAYRTHADALAIEAYLLALKPVKNIVRGPLRAQ